MDNRPIGIFDSGLGGLTVLRAIHELLPNENIVYFGDSGRTPYGTKSKETVIRYTFQDINFLLKQNVKMIVIACNTASACSLNVVKEVFDCPIVEVVEPGSLAACRQTKSKSIAVIGTSATISSGVYETAIKKCKPDAKVYSKACPLFVPLVEEGWWEGKISEMIACEYLKEFKDTDVDTLILGCTHYPMLQNVIRKVLGESVTLVNSAVEVANAVKKLLDKNGLQGHNEKSEIKYFTSDSIDKFASLGNMFLGLEMDNVERINIEKEYDKGAYYDAL
ncbi:MAG TPA: glutamate racemase [Clostridiaceae bacterium]|jgi:glutamate racemase|nr:glutamate racemase [Clostridiaceae bacterium]